MKDEFKNNENIDKIAKELDLNAPVWEEIIEPDSPKAIFTESFFSGIAQGCINESKAPVLLSGADISKLMAMEQDGTMSQIDPMSITEGMTIVIPCEDCLDMVTGQSIGYGDCVTMKVAACIGDEHDAVFMTENGVLSTIDFSEIVASEINRSGVEVEFPDLQEVGDISIGNGFDQGDFKWER